MARGGKRGHKGGRKLYTNPQALEEERKKEEREKAWRKARGEESEEEEGAEDTKKDNKKKEESSSEEESGSGSEEESSEEESSSEDEGKAKGAAGMIEIENPNRRVKAQKKVTDISVTKAKPELSRREREEIEKARAKANYQKLHAEGKTDEARADLARLAIIRKQREDAAKKREVEKLAKDAAAAKPKK